LKSVTNYGLGWRGVACNSRGFGKAAKLSFVAPPGVASNAPPIPQAFIVLIYRRSLRAAVTKKSRTFGYQNELLSV
jgi:hypothetical protein